MPRKKRRTNVRNPGDRPGHAGAPRLDLKSAPSRKFTGAAIVALAVIGLFLTRSSNGVAVTTWMGIFDPSDFPTVDSLVEFLKSIRVPIPPVLSAAEITNYILAGDTNFVTRVLYRIAIVGSFVMAIALSSGRILTLAGSVVLSLVFMWGTVVIHPGNAMTYDVAYPFFMLLCLILLKWSLSTQPGRRTLLLAAASGTALAMAELTRPFVIFLLPALLFLTLLSLRALPKRHYVAFLLPFAILSGGWHLHMAIQHGQLSWSNHSGNNLVRGWRRCVVADSEELQVRLLRERNNAPLKPGRRKNLNTAEHQENSKRLQRSLASFIVKNPLRSATFAAKQVGSLLFGVETRIHDHDPGGGILGTYRALVRLCSLWLLVATIWLPFRVIRSKGERTRILASPDTAIITIAFSSAAILAVGDDIHERARFLISILPFLAAIPILPLPIGAIRRRT